MTTRHDWMMPARLFLVALLAGCAAAESGGESEEPEPKRSASPASGGGDDLPGLAIEGRRVKLSQPMVAMVDGRRVQATNVVEFVVTSSEPIPARALDPIVAVGDRQVRTYRYEAADRMVFTELEPDKLRAGSPVTFHWGPGVSPTSRPSAVMLVYRPHELPEVER